MTLPAPILYGADNKPVLRETSEVGHPGIYGAINEDMDKFLSYFENQDVLIGKHGFKIYEEMYDRCGQVRSGLWYKVSISLSPKWKIDAAGTDEEDKKWARFVEYNLKHMRGSVNQMDWDLRRTAWGSGVAIMEINWREITEPGEWQGWIGIDSIKPRYPESFDFRPDKNGNLDKYGQLRQEQGDAQYVPLDPNKFIIYANDSRWSNWWGNSDLRPAHRPYLLKDWAFRWWAIFLEHFGGPIPIGRYDEFTAEGERTKWLNTLKKMKTMGAVIFPKSWDIELHSASGTHTDAFDRVIMTCDKQIGRAVIVPELVQSEGEGHGTYKLGVMQYNGPFLSHLNFKSAQAEEVVNEQLIQRLIAKNDPEHKVWDFPIFTRTEMRQTPDDNIIKLWDSLVNNPGWSEDMDEGVAQWLSTATGVPIPDKIIKKKTDDIDEAAGEANELMALMEDGWRKRRRLSRLPEVRSLLRRFARATVPTLDVKQADMLAQEKTAEWSNRLTELVKANNESGLAEFSTEEALWSFRKELRANGGTSTN